MIENMKAFFRHGLAFERHKVSAEDSQFIDAFVKKASEYRLETPLLLVIEGLRPVSALISGALIGMEPIAGLFFPQKEYKHLISFVENRRNFDELIERLLNR